MKIFFKYLRKNRRHNLTNCFQHFRVKLSQNKQASGRKEGYPNFVYMYVCMYQIASIYRSCGLICKLYQNPSVTNERIQERHTMIPISSITGVRQPITQGRKWKSNLILKSYKIPIINITKAVINLYHDDRN